jgi:hypothetical protein
VTPSEARDLAGRAVERCHSGVHGFWTSRNKDMACRSCIESAAQEAEGKRRTVCLDPEPCKCHGETYCEDDK